MPRNDSAFRKKTGSVSRAFFSENNAPMRLKNEPSKLVSIPTKLGAAKIVICSIILAVTLAVAITFGLCHHFFGRNIAISAMAANSLLFIVCASFLSAAAIKTSRNRKIVERVHEFNKEKGRGEEEMILFVKPAMVACATTSNKGNTVRQKLRQEASALLIKRARDSLKSRSPVGITEVARVIHDPFLNRNLIVRKGDPSGDLEISSMYLFGDGAKEASFTHEGSRACVLIKVSTWYRGVSFVPDKVHARAKRAVYPMCVVNLESRDGIWSVVTGSFDNSWGVSDSRRLMRSYVLYHRIFLSESLIRVGSKNHATKKRDTVKRRLIFTGSAADLLRYGADITKALQDPYPSVISSVCREEIEGRITFLSGMKLENIPDNLRNGTPLSVLRLLCVLSHSHDALLKELTLENQAEIITAFLGNPCLSTFVVQRVLEGILIRDERGNWRVAPSYDDVPRFAMCMPGLCDTLRGFAEYILQKPRSCVDANFIKSAISAASQVSSPSACSIVEGMLKVREEKLQLHNSWKNWLRENEKSLSQAMLFCAAATKEGVSLNDIEMQEEYGEYRRISRNYVDRCRALKEIVGELLGGVNRDGSMDCTRIGYLISLAVALQVRFMFRGSKTEQILSSVEREDSAESMARVLYESLHCGALKEDLYRGFSGLLKSTVDVPLLLPSGSIDFLDLSPPVFDPMVQMGDIDVTEQHGRANGLRASQCREPV